MNIAIGPPEMLLINCEINIQLKWSAKGFLVRGTLANQVPTFRITDKKLYISVNFTMQLYQLKIM